MLSTQFDSCNFPGLNYCSWITARELIKLLVVKNKKLTVVCFCSRQNLKSCHVIMLLCRITFGQKYTQIHGSMQLDQFSSLHQAVVIIHKISPISAFIVIMEKKLEKILIKKEKSNNNTCVFCRHNPIQQNLSQAPIKLIYLSYLQAAIDKAIMVALHYIVFLGHEDFKCII